MLLNKQGIAASSGSARTSGSLEPSHVMRATDIPYTAAHGTMRFSLSRYNTVEEIGGVIAAVCLIISVEGDRFGTGSETGGHPKAKRVIGA